jgi:S-formylglutathione hydrolase
MDAEEEPTILSTVAVRGGTLKRMEHSSKSSSTNMTFAVFFPSSYEQNAKANKATPVLYWLSGLTCNDTNFCTKAGDRAFEAANAEGIAMVMPDTSPRGDGVANDDNYDMGQGAGFYINATEDPWKTHFQMYDYVTKELPVCLAKWYKIGSASNDEETILKGADLLQSISGHSMGGHGALTIAFRDPAHWASVSAFSPICNPTQW